MYISIVSLFLLYYDRTEIVERTYPWEECNVRNDVNDIEMFASFETLGVWIDLPFIRRTVFYE